MHIWLLTLTVICAAVSLTSFLLYLFVPAKTTVSGAGTTAAEDFTGWPVTYQWPPRIYTSDTLGTFEGTATNVAYAAYTGSRISVCDTPKKFLVVASGAGSASLTLPAADSTWVLVFSNAKVTFPGATTHSLISSPILHEVFLVYIDANQWGTWKIGPFNNETIEVHTAVQPVDASWTKEHIGLELVNADQTASSVYGIIRYPSASLPTSNPGRVVEGALWSLFAATPSPSPLWKSGMGVDTLNGSSCYNNTTNGTYPLYSFSGSFQVVKPFDQSVTWDQAAPLGLHVLVQKKVGLCRYTLAGLYCEENWAHLPLLAHAVRVLDVTLRYPAMTELVVGQHYTFIPTNAASIAFLPNKVSITAGSLPAGLSLTADGHITGSPTTAGTGSFTASLVDDPTYTDTVSFKVSAAPVVSPSVPVPVTPTPNTTVTTTTDPSGQVIQIVEEIQRTTETKRPLFLWLGVGFGAAAVGGAAWLAKEAVTK